MEGAGEVVGAVDGEEGFQGLEKYMRSANLDTHFPQDSLWFHHPTL